jgi:proteasome lid subunit RPN8/RPN11
MDRRKGTAMRLATDHDLILEVLSPTGAELGRTLVQHLERHAEDARFSGICAGKLPPSCTVPTAHLQPVWRQAGVDPSLLGFTIEIACDCNGQRHTFSKSYGPTSLQRQIRDVVKPLLDNEQVRLDELQAHLCAFRKAPESTDSRRLRGVPEVTPLPLVTQSLHALLPDRTMADTAVAEPFSVLLPEHLIGEITAETLRSIGTEQAGVLLGQLHYDVERQHVFLHVTAQLLADTQVQRQAAAFHFRPETFLAAQQVIALRGRKEMVVGWWHSHAWCRTCLYAMDCQVSTLFFSDQDCRVHEAAFNQPYMVALVAGKAATKPMREPVVRMFGWQDGAIVARDFHCLTP